MSASRSLREVLEDLKCFTDIEFLKPDADKWPGPDSYIQGRQDAYRIFMAKLAPIREQLEGLAQSWLHDFEEVQCTDMKCLYNGVGHKHFIAKHKEDCKRCQLEALVGAAGKETK